MPRAAASERRRARSQTTGRATGRRRSRRARARVRRAPRARSRTATATVRKSTGSSSGVAHEQCDLERRAGAAPGSSERPRRTPPRAGLRARRGQAAIELTRSRGEHAEATSTSSVGAGRQSVDLPIPASPSSTSAVVMPSMGPSKKACSARSSSSLPSTSTGSSFCRHRVTAALSELEPEPLERRVVAAPLRAHLDDELEEDLAARAAARPPGRARTPISRIMEPRLPTRICFCDSVSTSTNARSDLVVELVELDRDRVRHLVAGQLERLLADELGDRARRPSGRSRPRAGSRAGPPAAGARGRRAARRCRPSSSRETGCSAWKSPSAAAAFIWVMMWLGFRLSTLFSATITGTPRS